MIGIRGTDNFIWSGGDQIGSGITGQVFKCREKKRGKPFAAKVLNANSELRPYEVRMRETEVLKKLSHPNIVLLFALEREKGSANSVIIMELCDISLYEILEQPENMNGLCDRDYLEVINDVSSGMEYLRASNVVHRDVKPGNILRAEKDNGRYIYKISDFGTARELGSNDKFTSYAYGTEEYLHPDLYERAVLKMSKNKVFDSTVDLWSLGVTFYHLATGQLPFQPYGGRQNKEVMFQMITSKKPGVISCHQDGYNGKLTFSNQLPHDTQITSGLKRLITPVLAGLLETDPHHMISHDMCFRTIRDIVDRKGIDVFLTKTSMIHRLYLRPEDNISNLQHTLTEELGVSLEEQHMFHDFREFKPDPMTPILHYPEITCENPLILDTKQYVPSVDIPVKKIPIVQLTTPVRTLDDLTKFAKLYSSLSHSIKQDTDMLLQILKAISKAHDVLEYNAEALFKKEQVFCDNLHQRISDKWNQLVSNNEHLCGLQKTKNSYNASLSLPEDGTNNYNIVMKLLFKLNSEFSDIFEKKVLMEEWFASGEYLKLGSYNDVILADVKRIKQIFLQFMKDRSRHLSNLDELTHRHEKDRLSTCYQRLQEQHASIIDHRNKLHEQFVKWLILLNHRKDTMSSLKEHLLQEVGEFDKYYSAKLVQYESGVSHLLTLCPHDFQTLEDELAQLDCIPDLLTMVQDQGEKLKMLQEMDASESFSKVENVDVKKSM